MELQIDLKKVLIALLIELSEEHSLHSKQTLIKDKHSKNDQLFNLLIQQWVDKRKCIIDGMHLLKKLD